MKSISPVDGRYHKKTYELAEYFSEFALIKYRLLVEIKYLKALLDENIIKCNAEDLDELEKKIRNLSEDEAAEIKNIEQEINHDVKAVEYFLKSKLSDSSIKEYVHFGLTSQDINNTAQPMMWRDGMVDVVMPAIYRVNSRLKEMALEWMCIPMLAHTHGQPASPTTVGKELMVYVYRLENEVKRMESLPHTGKFGGASGNMNAHYTAFPAKNWHGFADKFLQDHLGLERQSWTTQIENYDGLAAHFHSCMRLCRILADMCQDIWLYISMEYFSQKVVEGEVGSSAMPHKVNPIDFENAEGNLGVAHSLFSFLAEKLPVSRLQRDLTDSTVLRNMGVPAAHLLISLISIRKGLGKLTLNEQKLSDQLEENYAVLAEAVQTVLRAEGVETPYEKLKDFTRGKSSLLKNDLHDFIDTLNVSDLIKQKLKGLTPSDYIGKVYEEE